MCKRIFRENGETEIVRASVALALCSLVLAVACACVTVARYPLFYAQSIRHYAKANGLDPVLVAAVVSVESGFEPTARSGKGAVGLMQLLPSTAEDCAARSGLSWAEPRLTEPDYNIRLGCEYLRYLFDRFGSERLVLAAYNAGEGRVRAWLREGRTENIPYPETARYLLKVAAAKRAYEGRV